MRTKEVEEEEEGSRCGSLVERDPATENRTGERNQPSTFSRTAADSGSSSGLVSWLGVAIFPSDTVHWHWSQAQLRMHMKPNQCVSCGLFSHVRSHQGNSPPGVIPCRYVLLLKARKVYFSVTQWRHTLERREKKKKKKTKKKKTKTQEIK